MPEPGLMDLRMKFARIADWEGVCPYLLNDDTGEKTRQIRMSHHDIEECREEMINMYFRHEPYPTWQHVLAALRYGNYSNLANEIETELRGWYMYIHNVPYG